MTDASHPRYNGDMKTIPSIAVIRNIAVDVRWACENFADSPAASDYDCHDRQHLDSMCAIAAAALLSQFLRYEVESNFIVGSYDLGSGSSPDENHCWLELDDGVVVDITATQFEKCERVIIGSYAELKKRGMTYIPLRRLGSNYEKLAWRLQQQPTKTLVKLILENC